MSENVIFCFSGTGNCLDLAKNIAKALGDTDIIMMRGVPERSDVRDAKRVGFVFPCYGGGAPADVLRWAKRVLFSPDAYTFGISQSASYAGIGLAQLNKIVPLKYWKTVTHQCSCIWLLPHDVMLPKMDAASAQERSEKLAAQIGADVAACAENGKKPPMNPLNAAENKAFSSILVKKAKQFAVSDECIGCGQCVNICPRENIHLEAGKAVIGLNCAGCLGCLQFCPKSAISIGKITDKREHYHNSKVTAAELSLKTIHID